jgi:hypothetical protein
MVRQDDYGSRLNPRAVRASDVSPLPRVASPSHTGNEDDYFGKRRVSRCVQCGGASLVGAVCLWCQRRHLVLSRERRALATAVRLLAETVPLVARIGRRKHLWLRSADGGWFTMCLKHEVDDTRALRNRTHISASALFAAMLAPRNAGGLLSRLNHIRELNPPVCRVCHAEGTYLASNARAQLLSHLRRVQFLTSQGDTP